MFDFLNSDRFLVFQLWEVKFSRSGEFEKIHRAFELPGHTSGVFSFDFNADSTRMVTLSKDGTWRLFDTKIDFARWDFKWYSRAFLL